MIYIFWNSWSNSMNSLTPYRDLDHRLGHRFTHMVHVTVYKIMHRRGAYWLARKLSYHNAYHPGCGQTPRWFCQRKASLQWQMHTPRGPAGLKIADAAKGIQFEVLLWCSEYIVVIHITQISVSAETCSKLFDVFISCLPTVCPQTELFYGSAALLQAGAMETAAMVTSDTNNFSPYTQHSYTEIWVITEWRESCTENGTWLCPPPLPRGGPKSSSKLCHYSMQQGGDSTDPLARIAGRSPLLPTEPSQQWIWSPTQS